MLRLLAVATVALLAGVTAAGRRARPGEYVGLDHPSGELRLRLEPDGRFSLRLAVWDSVVGEFVGQRELVGKWRRCWEGLELRAPGRQVVYSRARGSVGGWIWLRSSLPTFADGFALLPERRVVSAIDDVARGAGDRRRWV
jgi:hypothetical protein